MIQEGLSSGSIHLLHCRREHSKHVGVSVIDGPIHPDKG